MTTKQIERAAYIAAHRILAANTTGRELACPGARRSRKLDAIAAVIREVLELHMTKADGPAALPERRVELGPHLVNPRAAGVVLELPLRTFPNEVA